MKLGHSADEVCYDSTQGTVARYVVILDEQITMHILCDSADPTKTIRITADLKTAPILDTKGVFTMKDTFTEDADGKPLGVESRVNEMSVYRYVLPRLHVLLGRLLRTYL